MEYDISENATPEELRIATQCAPTKEGFVRFQAVELLLGGYEKEDVARISDRSLDALIERTLVGLRSFIAAPHTVSLITSF